MGALLREKEKAPDFSLPNSNGEPVSLADFFGQWLVLYFYPKDNTSGCTKEAMEFSEMLPQFEAMRCSVVGVSPDSQQSHRRFKEKKGLTVTLLSDPEKTVLQNYGVWQLKRLAGREYMGVVRSTFLIDPDGIIRRVWTKVKVKGHVESVLDALRTLQK